MPARKLSQKKSVREARPTPDSVPLHSPIASRPQMPPVYGIPQTMEGSLPWEWANERLVKSHNYLITTVRPDGSPHSMVVWGIWLEHAYYFSTGATTRKAKNLAANPNCVVCNENIEEAVILEGKAQQLSAPEVPEAAFALYLRKYGWKLDPEMGPVFRVTPRVVFAMPEKLFPAGSTRWQFD